MPSFCAACGSQLDDNARFCTGCGAPTTQPAPDAEAPTVVSGVTAAPINGAATSNGADLGPEPAVATATALPHTAFDHAGPAAAPPPQQPFAQQTPTAQMPPVQPGPSYVAPPPPPPLPPMYFGQPAPPPEPTRGPSKGLIAGLAGALAVVVAGIVVAALVASGGSGSTPTVAAAAAQATATTVTPASNVTTVTRIIERPAKKKATKKSSSTSTSSSSAATPSTPAVRHTASTSSFTDKAEIRSVLQRHWSAIESGNYSQAFALLVPGTQSESSWISAHRDDALTSESLSLGSPTITSSTTATAPVSNLHTEAASGCFDWSGYYEMQKVGGDWRIGKAKISRSAC
jgi:hypothetical protein